MGEEETSSLSWKKKHLSSLDITINSPSFFQCFVFLAIVGIAAAYPAAYQYTYAHTYQASEMQDAGGNIFGRFVFRVTVRNPEPFS